MQLLIKSCSMFVRGSCTFNTFLCNYVCFHTHKEKYILLGLNLVGYLEGAWEKACVGDLAVNYVYMEDKIKYLTSTEIVNILYLSNSKTEIVVTRYKLF